MSEIIKENSRKTSPGSIPWLSYLFMARLKWRKQAVSFFNENFEIQRDTQFCSAIPTDPRQLSKPHICMIFMPLYNKWGRCLWVYCMWSCVPMLVDMHLWDDKHVHIICFYSLD